MNETPRELISAIRLIVAALMVTNALLFAWFITELVT